MQAEDKIDDSLVQVWKSELTRLLRDSEHAKVALKKIIEAEKKSTLRNVQSLKTELNKVQADRDHWKQRCQAVSEDAETDKRVKLFLAFSHSVLANLLWGGEASGDERMKFIRMLELRCDVEELSTELSQQTEYCARMGCACATLLWRLSRSDDSVQILLSGTQAEEFLGLVSSTLHSYITTYKNEMPEETSYETRFIHALAGVTTNIAASPWGRDFLAKTPLGCRLVDEYLTALSEAPENKCEKLKSLILMMLYNLSINEKGMQFISKKPNILSLLVWVIQNSGGTETKVHALRLLQSLIYEQVNPKVICEAKESLKMDFLESLSHDKNTEISKAASELYQDLCSLT